MPEDIELHKPYIDKIDLKCPKCGKNLNEGNCDCDHTEFDPRLESLRTLFNVDEEV